MNTALLISGFAMLSAGVSILALVRAYEGVVLAHVTIDPEGGDAAPSGTAREAPAPRRADIADNYLQPGAGVRAKDAERGLSVWAKAMQSASQGYRPPLDRPAGYGRTQAPCGCFIQGGKFLEKQRIAGERRMLCTRCGCDWLPASRNDFEIASDGDLQHRITKRVVQGHEWTRPYGDY